MENNITIPKIKELLSGWDNILILTHQNPDADCIGSAFAIKYAYPEKNIRVLSGDKIPKRLEFIGDGSRTDLPEEEYDHIMSVDTAALHLLGEAGKRYGDRIELKVDHHRTGEDYAKHNYTDPEKGSAGEIVYEILKDRLNPDTASALYSAIASDTGCFRYSNTTAQTHITAAELIEAGVDTDRINTLLFETKPRSEITATRLALNSLEYHFGDRVALVGFDNKMKKENGLDDDSLGAISSMIREIEGIELGIVVKEKSSEPGVFKASMRSKEGIDCSAVCKKLGGGGHIRAAGGSVEADSLEAAKKKVILAVEEYFNG